MRITDRYILVLSTLLFLGFTYLFITYNSLSETVEGLRIGEVSFIDKLVKKKGSKNIFWNEVNSGQAVFDGDKIFSDTNSAADIKFEDEAILKVPSETLIVLRRNSEGLNIDLQHGLVDLYFGKKEKKVKIVSKGKEAIIKGKKGKIEIVQTKTGLSIVPVSGSIEVTVANKTHNVSKNNTIEISDLKNKPPVVIKNIDLKLLTSRHVNLYKENLIRAKVSSELRGIIKFKISKSPSFISELKLKDRDLESEGVKFQIDTPGNYYIQAVQYKDDRIIGKSQTRKMRFYAELFESDLLPLTEKEIIPTKSGGLELSWKARRDLGYSIRLYDSTGRGKLLKSPTNTISLSLYRAGQYHYSVKADKPGYKWSPKHKINIKIDNYLKPVFPIESSVVGLQTFPDFIEFKWNGFKNEKYKFTLSKKIKKEDKEETEIIVEKVISNSIFKYRVSDPGQYSWSLEHEKFKGVRIDPVLFSVELPVAVGLRPPKNKKYTLKTKKFIDIEFKWRSNGAVEEKELSILLSKSETFDQLIKLNIKKDSARVRIEELGRYYWKIINRNDEKKLIDSDIHSFLVGYPIQRMIPSVAKQQIIRRDENNKKGYIIKFKGVKFAKHYQVEIYSDKDLKKLVSRVKTEKEYVYWVSNRDGVYFVRIRSLDVWGRLSPYSKVGKVIFPISPFL